MAEPSQLVAQQLQGHVHLISGQRFPQVPSLNLDQAVRYLTDAPIIVKQTAPMAWTYVQAPQDGTAWLEWIPRRANGEYHFASDGYLWGDPEQTFRVEFGGYMIEYMQHQVGYRPNHDHTASHARTRYHFVGKSPGMNAAQPDPSLWIVHYHTTEQNRMLPVNQIPVPPRMRQILMERRSLEAQGRLERKDFMLHDREHWPQITLPGMSQHAQQQQQGMYQNAAMLQQQQQQQQMSQGRFPQQQAYPGSAGQGGGQPPAKRPRHSGPGQMPGSSDGVHDPGFEDDENTLLDYFDHLTPRDISLARYSQHHRWMEEVFSSVYATSQIVPPDLGLGLMGELKGLTDGILDPPSVENTRDLSEIAVKGKREISDVQPFTNLRKEQVDEFNRRVEKHLADGQAEIERMKLEHAEKMALWKKTKTLTTAEKKLRYATWEGHEDAVPVYRLEAPAAGINGGVVEGESETVENIVKGLEDVLAVRIQAQEEAKMVQKGGLEEKEEPLNLLQEDEEMQGQDSQLINDTNGDDVQTSFDQQNNTTSHQPQPQQQLPDIPTNTLQMQPSTSALQQQQDSAIHDAFTTDQHNDMHGLGDMDMGDTSLIDMDVDDTGDIDFIDHDHGDDGEADDANAPPDQAADDGVDDLFDAEVDVAAAPSQAEGPGELVGGLEEQPSSADAIVAPVQDQAIEAPPLRQELVSSLEDAAQLEPQAEQQDPLPTSIAQDPIADSSFAASAEAATTPLPTADVGSSSFPPIEVATAEEAQASAAAAAAAADAGDDGLFDDTFDDLANMDDGHGDDALLDFDGMGMEESAFGDAMHGMEEKTPGEEG